MLARTRSTTLLFSILTAAALAGELRAAPPADGEAIRIREIRNQPAVWENRLVVVEGMVERILTTIPAGADGTRFFHLKDAYGDVLRIRTSAGQPDQRVLYRVRGTVSIDRRGFVYIAEEARSVVPLVPVEGFQRNVYQERVIDPDAVIAAATAQPAVHSGDAAPGDAPAQASAGSLPIWTWLAGGLMLGLLASILGPRFFRKPAPASGAFKGRPVPAAPIGELFGEPAAASASAAHGTGIGSVRSGAPTATRAAHAARATVARQTPPPGTVRVMPAWFEVEGQNGQLIRFFAVPAGGHRAQVTFGRDAGDAYSHVQLEERTVSRQQAVLSMIDGRYELENLSATNPTLVNGRPLGREPVTLHDGDNVQMGEVVLRFRNRQTAAA